MENNSNQNRFLTPEAEAENEWVAGITREKLNQKFNLPYSGIIKMDADTLVDYLQNNLEFRPRTEELERDESFKQLITYFVFRNKTGEIFLSQRKSYGGEARAHGAYLIGFGGHLRKEDIKGKMSDWLQREFEEEVKIDQVLGIKFIGLLNNDSDELQKVNRVHFGLVFMIEVDGAIEIVEKSKLEGGKFVTISELKTYDKQLETWSRVVLEELG